MGRRVKEHLSDEEEEKLERKQNRWKKWFKVVSWTYALKGPGKAIVCLKCGLSFNNWFSHAYVAELYIQNTLMKTGCDRCTTCIFEHEVLGDKDVEED